MWHQLPMRRFALLSLALALGCASPAHPAPAAASPAPRVLTILATSEVRGTPEPCGCQSDPLGDVARVASLVTEAKARGGVLLVDAGGLRYKSEPVKASEQAQAELKARFLEQAWQGLGAAVGLGDEDLSAGVPSTPRLCSNCTVAPTAGFTVAGGALRDVGGVKVGVFGLLDPARAGDKVTASDPVAAATREVAALSAGGAQVIVALAHLPRPEARRLARSVPGLSIVVAGEAADSDSGDGAEAEQLGDTIVVQPAIEGQRVAKVELHVVGGVVSTKLVASAEGRARDLEKLGRKVKDAELVLARLVKDPSADPAFVSSQRARLAELAKAPDALRAPASEPPAGASFATATLVPIRRALPRDPALATAMKKLDAEAGELNRTAGEKVPVPPAAPGEARYLGAEDCELCHPKQVEQWKTTVHAQAWKTLVDVNKQWSYDCIKCHVTGYGEAGGSAMAHVDKLEAVQCEVCHGPASLHAAAPRKQHLRVPVESDCKRCHTREHSDTFQFEAYLRDVLGPTHGAKRRAALGDGPTGHPLRGGAIEQAKAGAAQR